MIGYLYYCSPFTILNSSAIGCFQNILPFLLCYSIDEVLPGGKGSIVWSAFYLSLAAYCDVHYNLYIIPLLLFVNQQRNNNTHNRNDNNIPVKVAIITFTGCLITLHLLAYLLVGSSFSNYVQIVGSTSWYSFQLQYLEPSLSMLWYFSMEVFTEFRLYFIILLGAMPYLLITPLSIRLYQYPSVLVSCIYF